MAIGLDNFDFALQTAFGLGDKSAIELAAELNPQNMNSGYGVILL